MSWNIIIHRDLRIIETVFSETVNREDVQTYGPLIFQYSEENQITRILLDHTGSHFSLSVWELFSLPEFIEKMGFSRKYKTAIVSPDRHEDFVFLETVARNRGYNFRLFQNRIAAIDWLSS